MQLCAVNFIPLLNSLYMFRAAHTPIIRNTTVSTATGTIIGARHPREQVAVTTYAKLLLCQWL